MKTPARPNPPNARNGWWADPGWHNSGYTQPVEFLRADLGASCPAGGVGYAPREMGPPGAGDGSDTSTSSGEGGWGWLVLLDRELHGGGPSLPSAGTSVRVLALSTPLF